MISESEARKLLIDSCHSVEEAEKQIHSELKSGEFVNLLVRIAIDEDDYQGDAPMQAAYFVSQAATQFIAPHENVLLQLLESANGYAGFVALSLARIKSTNAKPIIAQRLKEGWWPEHLYQEALSCYERA